MSYDTVRGIRRRLGVVKESPGGAGAARGGPAAKVTNLGKLQELLDRSGIDLDDIEEIKSARVNSWQGFYKDAAGNAQTVDMEASKLSIVPKKNPKNEPQWPVIIPAQPVVVCIDKVHPELPPVVKTAIVFSDCHFGFRRFGDTLQAFHDDRVNDLLIQLVRVLNPNVLVNAGDFLDLPAQSKYITEPAFASTTQEAINAGYEFLAKLSAVASPDCKKVYLEGNHDIRLSNYILQNAGASFGLRRAACPDSWPVLSVPNLLRLDELKWDFLSGWPNNYFWLNEGTKIIHGSKLKIDAVADEEFINQIQGHSHRISSTFRTRRTFGGVKQTWASMIGCMARVDGALPSTKASLDVGGQATLSGAENWQQGFAVVTYDDESASMEQVTVNDGQVFFRGRVYKL